MVRTAQSVARVLPLQPAAHVNAADRRYARRCTFRQARWQIDVFTTAQTEDNAMMRIRAALVSILVAVSAGTGCDQIDEAPLAPATAEAYEAVSEMADSYGGWELARARIRQEATKVTSVIGRDGGWLFMGDHILYVAEGAVSGPTRFEMEVRAGEHIMVDLHAYSMTGQPVRTFPPYKVYLYMNYREAELANPLDFGVGYLPLENENSPIVPHRVWHFPLWTAVVANLTHFSTYALLID
jgi:hypothetical protein